MQSFYKSFRKLYKEVRQYSLMVKITITKSEYRNLKSRAKLADDLLIKLVRGLEDKNKA